MGDVDVSSSAEVVSSAVDDEEDLVDELIDSGDDSPFEDEDFEAEVSLCHL